MSIRAKFRCDSVTKNMQGNEIVSLFPVVAEDVDDVTWLISTPTGRLDLTVASPDAQGQFVPGADYFLDIEAVTT